MLSRLCRFRVVLPLLLGMLALGGVYAQWRVNLGSNLVALAVRHSPELLQVRTAQGSWRRLSSGLTPADVQAALLPRHQQEGLSWFTLPVRRPARWAGRLAQSLFGAEVHVLIVDPALFEFKASFREGFEPTTARERLQAGRLQFAINANFHDPAGKPLGYVYHEGRQVNAAFKQWSGSFFVKAGRPYFGPKSLLEEVPGVIEEATQGYPAVMKHGQIFSYIAQDPDAHFNGSKVTYRALAGMRADGSIVMVLSGDGGLMTVAEVAALARRLDVQHATLLDGGRALQYSLQTEDGPWHFAAANTEPLLPVSWLKPQRSPVYIAVRRRAPRIVVEPGR